MTPQAQQRTPAASIPMAFSGPPLPSYSSLKTSRESLSPSYSPRMFMPDIPDQVKEGEIAARFRPRRHLLPVLQSRGSEELPRKFTLKPRKPTSRPLPTKFEL